MEKNDEKYNGWTNYETWATNLWMDNEESSYKHARQMARDTLIEVCEEDFENPTEKEKDDAYCALSETLKEDMESSVPELPNGIFSDLLNAALSEINWHEIAQHLIDECLENFAYKKDKKKKSGS